MFSFLLRVPDTADADALFSEAYACLEQGLCYDEINDWEQTLRMYERGLNLIKEAEKTKNAKKSELYKNLMDARKSVEWRITVLRKEGPKVAKKGAKELIIQDESSVKVKSDIREKLDEVGDQEADLIYFLPDGVQLFTINGDITTVPTDPTSLQILRFNGNVEKNSLTNNDRGASAFIQVGPWIYPLIREKTPVLRNDYGAYVVPNPTAENPNMLVAILLPSNIGTQLEEEFKQVLSEFAILRDQDIKKELTSEENKRISDKIAQFLISSGERIAWGVQTTTVKVVAKFEDKGEKYRAELEPTNKPMGINPVVKGSVVYMHKGTKVVAKCTRYLLDKIGDMGITIGRSLASGAQKTFGDGKTGGVVSGTITVLGGGIASVSTIWIALENGSRTLCRSIANQTVQNVKIRYGNDASEATHHALFAAGHGSLATMQLLDLGPRSIAGRMARKAGIQMVSDLHESQRDRQVKNTAIE